MMDPLLPLPFFSYCVPARQWWLGHRHPGGWWIWQWTGRETAVQATDSHGGAHARYQGLSLPLLPVPGIGHHGQNRVRLLGRKAHSTLWVSLLWVFSALLFIRIWLLHCSVVIFITSALIWSPENGQFLFVAWRFSQSLQEHTASASELHSAPFGSKRSQCSWYLIVR